jgi:HAD superfamily hydrolase (TIGR01484 family)
MLKKIRVSKPYIFIFDFDGTISKTGSLDQSGFSLFNYLDKNNQMYIINSGRSVYFLKSVFPKKKFKCLIGLSGNNGSELELFGNYFSTTLELDNFKKIVQFSKKNKFLMKFHTANNSYFLDLQRKAYQGFIEDILLKQKKYVRDERGIREFYLNPVYKNTIEQNTIMVELFSLNGFDPPVLHAIEYANITPLSTWRYLLQAKGINKGYIMELLNIMYSDIKFISFGDDLNDIPMFEKSEHAFINCETCMPNKDKYSLFEYGKIEEVIRKILTKPK